MLFKLFAYLSTLKIIWGLSESTLLSPALFYPSFSAGDQVEFEICIFQVQEKGRRAQVSRIISISKVHCCTMPLETRKRLSNKEWLLVGFSPPASLMHIHHLSNYTDNKFSFESYIWKGNAILLTSLCNRLCPPNPAKPSPVPVIRRFYSFSRLLILKLYFKAGWNIRGELLRHCKLSTQQGWWDYRTVEGTSPAKETGSKSKQRIFAHNKINKMRQGKKLCRKARDSFRLVYSEKKQESSTEIPVYMLEWKVLKLWLLKPH